MKPVRLVGLLLCASCGEGLIVSATGPAQDDAWLPPPDDMTPVAAQSTPNDMTVLPPPVTPADAGSTMMMPPGPMTYPTDALAGLPTGQTQLNILCGKGGSDAIVSAFCASTPPTIRSLTDLQKLIGLDFKPGVTTNGTNGNPGFVLTSHSSSLAMRSTNVLTPRAIIFTPAVGTPTGPRAGSPTPNPSYAAMGFVRGEQFVELAAKGLAGQLRFFLFRYEQACNTSPSGCTFADLQTPAVESNFTSWSLYDEEDLKNTTLDCRQCHQPQGPGTPRVLRMQELQFPWTHFIFVEPTGNVLLKNDFYAAHAATEPYAGIPAAVVGKSAPPVLESFIENNGFLQQPNEFQTKTIDLEVMQSAPQQPAVNNPPGQSATWSGLFSNFLSGSAIPPPYHDFRITDSAKLATGTTAYKSFMAGSATTLPDLRDVVLDAALPDMAVRPRAGLTGRQILMQMCRQCHNSHLDQSVSRANFNVEQLDQMPRAEKDLAIYRLGLPRNHARVMPPVRFRELSPAEIALAVGELQK